MANENTLHGYIEGPLYYGHPDLHLLWDRNRAVIAALPQDAPLGEPVLFPQITRSFFCIAGRENRFRSQIIHFGGSYHALEYDWEQWLLNFEAILRRLYWLSALLHMEGDVAGGGYEWFATEQAMEQMLSDEPQPITEWEFEGGPRQLR